MKRSPLKRKTPLRAASSPAKPRKRLPAKRATERRSSRVRDEEYLAWCRLQPCAISSIADHIAEVGVVAASHRQALVCSGRTEPDHERGAHIGMGKKADDRAAWPCCQVHHRQRHDLAGIFKGWSGAALNAFIADRISEANARYDAERASREAS